MNKISLEDSSEVEHLMMPWYNHRLCGGQDNSLMSKVTEHKRTTKLTESTNIQKAIAMH